MKRRILAIAVTLMMVINMMPANLLTSFAAESGSGTTETPLYLVENPPAKDAASTRGVYLNKTLSDLNEDGEGVITLETYVTGRINTESKPVDIIMVLDMSTSMENDFSSGQETYNEAYPSGQNGTYYIKSGNSYKEVEWCNDCNSWTNGCSSFFWHSAGTSYTPKTSATDTTAGSEQFYVKVETRLDALKQAADSFVDNIASRDEGHKIAIVGFHDKGVYLSGSTAANSLKDATANASSLKAAIDGIDSDDLDYATDHNDGLLYAENILNKNIDNDRKKVVILFTDGEPEPKNSGDWSSTIVKEAVDSSYRLKNTNDASVYVISVLPGADPTDTSEPMDRYMNYVSSNYLNAKYTGNYSGTNEQRIVNAITPGEGTYGGKYYQTANNMSALDGIFDAITDDVQSISLDKTTIVQDVMSESFEIDIDNISDTSAIEIYEVAYSGNGVFAAPGTSNKVNPAQDGYNINITANGKAAITGFDFEPVIEATSTTPVQGKKLVIKIPIKIKDSVKTNGATVDSNNNGELISSVIGNTDHWDFNTPKVTLPVYVSGTKTWEGDEASKRPESINIDLYARVVSGETTYYLKQDGSLTTDQVVYKTTTTTEAKNWKYEFEPAPKYLVQGTSKTEIEYFVVEQLVDGYVTIYNGYDITNKIPAEFEYTTSFTGTKTWNDDGNKYSSRPGTLEVKLYMDSNNNGIADDGDKAVDITPTWKKDGSKWTYSFDNIPVFDENGDVIKYVAKETVPSKYEGDLTEAVAPSYALPETVDYVTVTPCNNTSFDANLNDVQIPFIAAKMGGKFSIWTAKELSSAEKALIDSVAAKALGGFQTNKTTYVHGIPANMPSSNGGIAAQIFYEDGKVKITFSDKSDWSMWAYGAINGTYTQGKADFTNSFQPDPATAVINGSKTLNGRDMKADETFSFNIKAADEATRTAISNGDITGLQTDAETVSGGTNGTPVAFSFDELTFNKEGTYKFEVTEKAGNAGGVTYDGHTEVVTVTVAPDTAAKALKATVSYSSGGNNAAFVNTYDAADAAPINLEVIKTLQGREWIDGDSFTFTLEAYNPTALINTAAGSLVLPASVTITDDSASHKAQFGDIVFKSPGTYQLKITENVPDDKNGITYDPDVERIVTIVVTDNGNGKLETAVTYDSASQLTFVNTYSVSPTSIAFSGNKVLEGRTLGAAEFDFTIVPVNTTAAGLTKDTMPVPAQTTVNNGSDGSVNFGNIKYSVPGTYVYTIKETKGSLHGVTYDGGTVTATVKVTEDKAAGTLAASVTYSKNDGEAAESFTFNNKYVADSDPVDLNMTKTLGGVEYELGIPEFKFTLTPSGNNANDPIKNSINVSLNKAGQIDFGDFVYTVPGTYVYSVSEQQGTINNMIYDNKPVEVTVVVKEQNNKLVTDVTYKKDGKTVDGITFANTYSPTGTNAVIGGMKTVSGNKHLTTEVFTFKIEAVSTDVAGLTKDTMPIPNPTTVNNRAGEFVFEYGEIQYTVPGEYVYKVTEVKKADANEMPGYTYDRTEYTVKVNVTDNNGVLVSDVKYYIGDKPVENNEMNFDNEYDPIDAVVEVAGDKVLSGRDLKSTDIFEFNISAVSTTAADMTAATMPMPANAVVNNEAVTGGSTAAFTFGNITFTKPGVYTYSVTETNPDSKIPGITYSTEVYSVVITITDEGFDGELDVASVEYIKNDTRENALTFTNTYAANSITAQIAGDKTLTGRDMLADESFGFTLTPADRKTEAAVGEGGSIAGFDNSAAVTGGTNGDPVGFAFDQMTFTEAGTFTFNVTENIPEDAENNVKDGVTYDASEIVATVTVTDEGDGQLRAAVTYSKGNKASFTNSYAFVPGQLDGNTYLKVIKNFKGRDWTAGDSFSFTLTAGNDATQAAITNGEITMPAGNLTITKDTPDYTAAFGNITFTKEGNYEFKVTESVPQDKKGIAYDNDLERIVKVNVTDNKAGQLVATVTSDSDSLTYNNIYSAAPVEVAVGPEKVLEGREWLDTDSFGFTIEAYNPTAAVTAAADDNAIPESTSVAIKADTAGHAASFGKMTFTSPGVYKYKVSEVIPQNTNGITYDTDADRIVTVTVTDNGEGQLVAAVAYDTEDKLVFTNKYAVSPTTANIAGSKVLEGRSLAAGEFVFTIAAKSTTADGLTKDTMPVPGSLTAVNNAAGAVDFGSINFTKAGTYVYEITENAGNLENVTYDKGVVTATVEVTENKADGTLSAAVTYSKAGGAAGEGFTFTNKYVADSEAVPFTAVKSLTGYDYKLTEGLFSFTLSPVIAEGSTAVAGDPVTQPITVSNDANGNIDFGSFVFTEPGTYVYSVSENQPDPGVPGITYDNHPVQITVVVTEQDNKLVTAVTYEKNGEEADAITFANTYKPEGTTAVIKGQKAVTGNKSLTTEEFEFEITAVTEDAPLPEVSKVKNNTAGEFEFVYGDILYTEPGTYVYEVKEVAKKSNSEKPGYTYDDTVYTVTVVVTDDKTTGKLKSEVTYKVGEEAKNAMKFANNYDPTDATVTIIGDKELIGYDRTLNAGEFTFKLMQGNTVVDTAVNDAEGNFSFKALTYDKVGEHTYTIVEDVPSSKLPGVTYSAEIYTVVVNVTDTGFDGELDATVTYYNDNTAVDDEEVIFENSYDPEDTTATIIGSKTLTGRDMKADDSFTFTLEAANREAKEILAEKETVTINGGTAAGNTAGFQFGTLKFDKEGTYEFNVNEVAPDKTEGVTYDTHTAKVKVTVTDNEVTGELEAVVTYDNGNNTTDNALFTNTYAAAETSAVIKGIKTLNGRDLKADEFSFTIVPQNGAPAPAETTVKNAGNGTVNFGSITYTEAGTYIYEITETGDMPAGVTIDAGTWTATVKVTDDGKGQLHAAVTYSESAEATFDQFEFVNEYKTTAPDPVSIEAKKTVTTQTGNDYELKGGDFKFELVPGQNNPADDPIAQLMEENAEGVKKATLENDANGLVSIFDDVIFGTEGTYTYSLFEINSGIKGFGYSETKYLITVTVKDNVATAKMESGVTYQDITDPDNPGEAKELTFVNTYNPSAATALIYAHKTVQATEGNAYVMNGSEFTFKLTSKDGAPMPAGAKNGVITAVNDKNGVVSFPQIRYETAGTYEYTITEVAGEVPGIVEYSGASYDVTVVVTDDEKGTLTAVVNGLKDENGKTKVEFVNKYDPSDAKITLKALKVMEGAGLSANDYEFKLTGEGQDQTAANADDGTVTFGEITYDRPGTYTYTVSEVIPENMEGIIYDGKEYTVVVKVTDKGGKLEAVAKVDGEEISEPADLTFTNTYEETEATITKVWEDAGNQDGKRPNALEVTLTGTADDKKVSEHKVELNDANKWTATVENLPVYADGEVITYSWSEPEIAGYTQTGNVTEGTETTITNSHTPQLTTATVKKVWEDSDNQDGIRPAAVKVQLYADGQPCGDPVTVTAKDNWTYTWTDLDLNAGGTAIVYTVDEVAVPDGYEKSVEGMTITNRHVPSTVDIPVTKTWSDKDDQDGIRPASITVRLLADGEEVASASITAESEWKHVFTGMPEFKAGEKIVYTVTEDACGSYATAVDGYDIVNSYTPGKTSVTVTKVWDDANNQDGKREDSVTVQLLADGRAYGEPVVLNGDNSWTYTWTELDEKKAGKAIGYTVEETEVPEGYTVEISGDQKTGYIITNSYVPETTEITVYKQWKDGRDQYNMRPGAVTAYLYADGEVIQTIEISAANNWEYTVTDLPVYADGKEIAYTVTEKPVDGYESVVDGYKIVNTVIPPDKPTQTGDGFNGGLYGALALMAALTGAGVVFGRRRREDA